MDGVLGMALSPWEIGHERLLYYHSLASTTENVIGTSVLKNDTYMTNSNVNSKFITVSLA